MGHVFARGRRKLQRPAKDGWKASSTHRAHESQKKRNQSQEAFTYLVIAGPPSDSQGLGHRRDPDTAQTVQKVGQTKASIWQGKDQEHMKLGGHPALDAAVVRVKWQNIAIAIFDVAKCYDMPVSRRR